MEKLFDRSWSYHPYEFRLEGEAPSFAHDYTFATIDTHEEEATVTHIHTHLDKDFVLLKKSSNLEIPLFPKDKKVFEELIKKKSSQAPLGLVLVGGKSERMGRDKFSLEIQNETLVSMAYKKLSKVCPEVFLSCRKEQADHPALKPFPQIHDRFMSLGPTGGIMSAMVEHPTRPWLILACDLPVISEESLKDLILTRDPLKVATCYSSPVKRGVDPLCALYEPKALMRFFEFIALGSYCPRKMLNNSPVHILQIKKKEELQNFNTPEEFEKLIRK